MSQQWSPASSWWTFDDGLNLWYFFDGRTGQTIYWDGVQYVPPPHSSPWHAPVQDVGQPIIRQQDVYRKTDPSGHHQDRPGSSKVFKVEIGSYHGTRSPQLSCKEDGILPAASHRPGGHMENHENAPEADSLKTLATGLSSIDLQSNQDLDRGILENQATSKDVGSSRDAIEQGMSSNSRRASQLGDKGLLYEDFKRVSKPRKFFVTGKVFLVLWSEPGGDSSQTYATGKAWTKNNYGEWVYSKVRRFVVIKEADRSCTAVPVLTYNGQGVAKKGVIKSDHAIIFTGKHSPSATLEEEPNASETIMRPHAIRVDPDQRGEKLDTMSRVDFGSPQKVQHYFKVKSFGKVNRDSLAYLEYQFRAVSIGEPNTPSLPSSLTTAQISEPDGIEADPLLSKPKFRAAYDALIRLNYPPEQAALLLHERAKAIQETPHEGDAEDEDYESDTTEEDIENESDT